MSANKIAILLYFSILSFNFLSAQNSNRHFISLNDNGTFITIKVNDGTFQINPVNNNIIHCCFKPDSLFLRDFSFVDKPITQSGYTLTENENEVMISTDGISLKIAKHPFQLYYFYKENPIIEEKDGFVYTDSIFSLNFSITGNEVLYGGGARVLGMNRRGTKLELYNRAHYGYTTHAELMNFTLPVVISSKKYSLFIDNASKAYLDLDSDSSNTISYETKSGTLNYYIAASDDWYNLTDHFTDLTGKQPLPPRWAFGNFSSRFGYHSQEEVLSTIIKFEEDNIPVDAVIIDIYWFGPGIFNYMGKLDWYRDSFPNPDKMIKELKAKGVKTILVTEPFILTTSDRWKEAVEENVLGKNAKGEPYTYDFYFGNTGLVDVFKPEARQWFWNIYKALINQGVEGMWGDLGEPEVHPGDLIHEIGTADEIHNAYGHEWTKLIYEGYQNDFPDVRPFILMRAGYAGSQKYGIIPWTGDVSRSWGGLVSQPEISLQMGMQGIAYMHSDLGGFAGGDSIDNELYIRWLQYGVFQPIYRPHAQEHIPAEPVFHNDTTKAHAKKAIELRYKLLPYIYNLAFENSQTGIPLMRPLFFNESGNEELLEYDDAYMWGDAFLVSPVIEAGKKYQQIYFPKGSNWTDFNAGKQYNGGSSDSVKLSIDHIPVFVKNGSFVPELKEAKNTSQYNLKDFRLKYFHDTSVLNASYTLYNDDGKTPGSFETGKYENFYFSANWDENQLTIVQMYDAHNWPEATQEGKIELLVYHLNDKPKKILLNNKKLSIFNYDWCDECNVLFIFYEWTKEKTEVKIIL